jgi:hypothetical protein
LPAPSAELKAHLARVESALGAGKTISGAGAEGPAEMPFDPHEEQEAEQTE